MLPTAVLERAQRELPDWQGLGMSVMEMSHRSDEFVHVAEQAETRLRQLMQIPENYRVLFLQGGASLQFSAIPLNLLAAGRTADYIDTGIWSQKAIEEAGRFGQVNVAASSREQQYRTIPEQSQWQLTPQAAYLHYTPNETIGGLQFDAVPDITADVPLIADASSCILSALLPVARFGLIYAGAQKNIGPAGLTIVIVRDDLTGKAQSATPSLLDYAAQAKNGSMINTPPTFAWYLAGLVFEWMQEQGGVEAMQRLNQQKAALLYNYIDQSGFYANPIDRRYRSIMNIPFTLPDAGLEKPFLQQAAVVGLLNLAGHRSVGGMRASIYNAMPLEGVQALVAFMQDFAGRHSA